MDYRLNFLNPSIITEHAYVNYLQSQAILSNSKKIISLNKTSVIQIQREQQKNRGDSTTSRHTHASNLIPRPYRVTDSWVLQPPGFGKSRFETTTLGKRPLTKQAITINCTIQYFLKSSSPFLIRDPIREVFVLQKKFQWGLRSIMSRRLYFGCHAQFLILFNMIRSMICDRILIRSVIRSGPIQIFQAPASQGQLNESWSSLLDDTLDLIKKCMCFLFISIDNRCTACTVKANCVKSLLS